ncbi:MAG TPA: hypothetical protein VKE40_08215 [Gemmataceae bacterium]|nr:hypothetical protein [Gemmataceae bacterium]
MRIVGLDGISDREFAEEIQNGARFVVYQYCVSLLIVTFKQPTNIYFVRAGQSRVVKGLPWTLLSWVVGWWGFPFGIIFTIWVTATNFAGGTDVTDEILAQMAPPDEPPPEPDSRAAALGFRPRRQPPPAAD